MSKEDKRYSSQGGDCPHHIVMGQGGQIVCDAASGKV
jgi:hypothetical protein